MKYLNPNMMALLMESLEGKLPQATSILLGKKSRWPWKSKADAIERADVELREVAGWDPTPQKQYIMYIAKQMALGAIRLPEDGPQLQETLSVFHNRKNDWAGKSSVFDYKFWRKLNAETSEYNAEVAFPTPAVYMNKMREIARGQAEIVLDETINLKGKGSTRYIIIFCTGPMAVALHGLGSTWCTSATPIRSVKVSNLRLVEPESFDEQENFLDTVAKNLASHKFRTGNAPALWEHGDKQHFIDIIMQLNNWDEVPTGNQKVKVLNNYFDSALGTAESYLKKGPLIIIKKDGKPYLQISSYGEIMGTTDTSLSTAGKATAYILAKLIMKRPEIAKYPELGFYIVSLIKPHYRDVAVQFSTRVAQARTDKSDIGW